MGELEVTVGASSVSCQIFPNLSQVVGALSGEELAKLRLDVKASAAELHRRVAAELRAPVA